MRRSRWRVHSLWCAVNRVSNFDGNLGFVGKRVEFGSQEGCFGAILHRQNENNQNLICESRMPLPSEISFIIISSCRKIWNAKKRVIFLGGKFGAKSFLTFGSTRRVQLMCMDMASEI